MDQKAQKKAESDLIDSIAEDMNKGSEDKYVIDSMFRVGELMSDPPTGGCTFAGFTSLPVIQLLSGDREFDLSPSELKECWKDGSLGEVRVDLSGFERVWKVRDISCTKAIASTTFVFAISDEDQPCFPFSYSAFISPFLHMEGGTRLF